MTPSSTQCIPDQLNLGTLKGRKVIANFEGGRITSDAGIVLMAELDKKLKITARFAECFRDYRNSSYVDYSVHELLAQRVYGTVLGYEDVNDHEKLRYDPALAIALGRLNSIDSNAALLAGKSTINRLEYCPETILDHRESRYHKIEQQPQEIEKAFVEIFLESYKETPRQIVLDMDVTDDQVHGRQEGAFFNTYYNGVCYAPLYIFCGHHLLAAKLRCSNVDPAAGALEELPTIIRIIRRKWQNTQILVRGDSAYAREDIMKFCEAEVGVDYAFAMATNNQLKFRAHNVIKKDLADYEQRLAPVTALMETLFSPESNLEEVGKLVPEATWYCSLCYKTQESWSRERRVVTKVCYGSEGLELRHVVTSLPAAKVPPSKVYTDKYCPRGDQFGEEKMEGGLIPQINWGGSTLNPRTLPPFSKPSLGEMENRIKEQQLDLFADRTSTQTFESNQLRLWLSSMAYVLMQAFRQHCLTKTSLSQATVGTVRLALLKLGAKITVSVRRVLIAIASACPYQDILAIAYQRIQAIPTTG